MAEREGRLSHNAAAHTVISACLLSFFFLFFTWEGEAGSLEVWEGLGVNQGGVDVRFVVLELWRLVLADGNRNKTEGGGL